MIDINKIKKSKLEKIRNSLWYGIKSLKKYF